MNDGEKKISEYAQPTLVSKAKPLPHPDFSGHTRFNAPSVIELEDPASKIHNTSVPIMMKEVQGYLIALTFEGVDFTSYEVYSYVEDTLKTEVADLSIFRDIFTNEPTGLVVIQLIEEVGTGRLAKLSEQPFKGHPVKVRLFSKEEKFKQFVENTANEKVKYLSLPLKKSTPVIYIQNYPGDEDSLAKLLERCGKINLIRVSNIRNNIFYIVFFDRESAAHLAYITFNGITIGGHEIIVTPHYQKSNDRSFGVQNCDQPAELRNQIEDFGHIESIKEGQDGVLYFLMESLTAAKFACILINSRKIGTNRVFTFFVEYEYFQSIKS